MATKTLLINICLTLLLQNGCCWRENNHSTPPQAQGWRNHRVGSVEVKGSFVLKKGQATNNEKLGIRVVTMSPRKYCFFQEPTEATVRMQFYDPTNQGILCDKDFNLGGALLRGESLCGSGFEDIILYVTDINADDNWVSFELR